MTSNPLLKEIKNFYIYLIFWLVIIIIYVLLISINTTLNFDVILADGIIFNALLAGFCLSYWYSIRYNPFDNKNILKTLAKHLVGGIFITAVWLLLGYYIIKFFLSSPESYNIFFFNTLAWRFLIGILFYFLTITFYYVVVYYADLQERTSNEAELKNLVTQAELKSLKFQINPHFIFNSLNSMSSLTIVDPDKSRNMILKLADFLRYSLANSEKQMNKLSEELKNINLYLDIEKIRFENKFKYIENVEKECLDIQVPNLILQPLFENAIKHAVYETLGKVTLKLNAAIEKDFLHLILENNFDPDSSNKKGTGIGLKNIENRLELIYNQKNLIKLVKEENQFKVELYIPA